MTPLAAAAPSGTRMRAASLVAVMLCGGLLSACGGDASGPAGSRENPVVARPNPSHGRTGAGSEAGHGSTKHRRAKPAAPSTRWPCRLVTEAQAETIVGAPLLEPIRAPQGPTCIYRNRSGNSYVTLAVQSISLATLEPQLRRRKPVKVGDRRAYCASSGRPMLYLQLSARRVLSVAGPCPVARQFAIRAIAKL